MIVILSKNLVADYPAGGYNNFKISLDAGEQVVDDDFGQHILEAHPDVVSLPVAPVAPVVEAPLVDATAGIAPSTDVPVDSASLAPVAPEVPVDTPPVDAAPSAPESSDTVATEDEPSTDEPDADEPSTDEATETTEEAPVAPEGN